MARARWLQRAAEEGARGVIFDIPDSHPAEGLARTAGNLGWKVWARRVGSAELGDVVARDRTVWVSSPTLRERPESWEDLGLVCPIPAPVRNFLLPPERIPEASWVEGLFRRESRVAAGNARGQCLRPPPKWNKNTEKGTKWMRN